MHLFAMVVRMSDNHHVDPSGNTEAFRAFTQNAPQEAATSKIPLIVAGVAGVVVVLALVIWAVS
ncbi:hypothetical protein Ari01nite_14630 [Paractinoplanes rishiriensis]|uniref:Uncharacterized protein n=2 Tax=Paractinoplanes rishiriensis TaxID=1050105 RepID=A0A919MSR6_9ACTN|nr:hypothetical protein Ari01nite_14630 [Actinoplanes rishiriensis]